MTLLALNLTALNLNARIGKLALIAAAIAIFAFAALGGVAVTEAAGGAQAAAVANNSCDGGYWPALIGGLFGWLLDLLIGLC